MPVNNTPESRLSADLTIPNTPLRLSALVCMLQEPMSVILDKLPSANTAELTPETLILAQIIIDRHCSYKCIGPCSIANIQLRRHQLIER